MLINSGNEGPASATHRVQAIQQPQDPAPGQEEQPRRMLAPPYFINPTITHTFTPGPQEDIVLGSEDEFKPPSAGYGGNEGGEEGINHIIAPQKKLNLLDLRLEAGGNAARQQEAIVSSPVCLKWIRSDS